MSLSGRWGDAINHGVWKPWLRAIKWKQKIEQKLSSKFARVQMPDELFMWMFMLYEDRTIFQHTDSYESNDIRLTCTIWKCKDIDPRTDPHKVNFVCTVCFLVTPVLNTSRSSGITFSEIQVFKSASTSPVEATEGWFVACHSHLALLFVCASQKEHYSQATIDRYASIYIYIIINPMSDPLHWTNLAQYESSYTKPQQTSCHFQHSHLGLTSILLRKWSTLPKSVHLKNKPWQPSPHPNSKKSTNKTKYWKLFHVS